MTRIVVVGATGAVGHVHFDPVHEMGSNQFMEGILGKTLPQVNLDLPSEDVTGGRCGARSPGDR